MRIWVNDSTGVTPIIGQVTSWGSWCVCLCMITFMYLFRCLCESVSKSSGENGMKKYFCCKLLWPMHRVFVIPTFHQPLEEPSFSWNGDCSILLLPNLSYHWHSLANGINPFLAGKSSGIVSCPFLFNSSAAFGKFAPFSNLNLSPCYMSLLTAGSGYNLLGKLDRKRIEKSK